MLVIRMSRHGAKKRPYYHLVVTDSRNPRDGRFIEKVGTYNPMVEKDHPTRVTLVEERIKYWISVGAQPSDRVARILSAANLIAKIERIETPKKSAPKAKAQERLKAAEEAKKAAAEAATAPAEPAAEEAPAA